MFGLSGGRAWMAAAVLGACAAAPARGDETIPLPGVEFNGTKLEFELTRKAGNEVCGSGELKAKVGDKVVPGNLVGAELCGKHISGGLKITGKADAGKVKNLKGKEVNAAEVEVGVRYKNDKITKGKAALVLATGGKDPKKKYFTYADGKFKEASEDEYNKVDLEH